MDFNTYRLGVWEKLLRVYRPLGKIPLGKKFIQKKIPVAIFIV